MKNEELLRAFDFMTAMLIAYDNQSRNPSLARNVETTIEEIRGLIKAREEPKGL